MFNYENHTRNRAIIAVRKRTLEFTKKPGHVVLVLVDEVPFTVTEKVRGLTVFVGTGEKH